MSRRGKAIEIKPCILIYGKPYISLVQAAKVLADNLGGEYAMREYARASAGTRPDYTRIQAKAAEKKKRAYPRFKYMLEKAMAKALT
jgi:hypothetical protein